MYAAQGFEGDLLKRVVETATADKERWLRIMMTEELGLPPEALRWRLSWAALVTLVRGWPPPPFHWCPSSSCR